MCNDGSVESMLGLPLSNITSTLSQVRTRIIGAYMYVCMYQTHTLMHKR